MIGCNSWAWAFLVKAAGVDVLLPPARTFAAFDAERLPIMVRRSSASTTEQRQVTFRLVRSGEDVLERGCRGQLANSYLRQLAARSVGVPWVAWHLWRTALRAPSDVGEVSARAAEATDGDLPDDLGGGACRPRTAGRP